MLFFHNIICGYIWFHMTEEKKANLQKHCHRAFSRTIECENSPLIRLHFHSINIHMYIQCIYKERCIYFNLVFLFKYLLLNWFFHFVWQKIGLAKSYHLSYALELVSVFIVRFILLSFSLRFVIWYLHFPFKFKHLVNQHIANNSQYYFVCALSLSLSFFPHSRLHESSHDSADWSIS